ncbi:MAG: transposase [Rhodobacter sp.]|nr:transposase [Rhodobacter sp.]
MTAYRRLRRPGATYAFTLCLQQPGSTLLTQQIDRLRSAWRTTLGELPVRRQAVVVLPDHLLAIWTEPEGAVQFPERWRRIKARFSRTVSGDFAPRPSLQRRRERGIWQRRYWEHMIRDAAELDAALETCRLAPVRLGLVTDASDWPYSSFSARNR